MDQTAPPRRRTFLQLVAAAAGGSYLPAAAARQASDGERTIVLEQDGRCVPITPLTGDEPVEDLYDYTYPTDRYDGPPGSEGSTYSSHGTTDVQRDDTSVLFLYDGPEGLSLVVVHGRLEGDRDAGGTVTFTVAGLPSDGRWIVRDDYYLTDDGEPAPSNFDRWDLDGEDHVIDWAYRGGRTDGGAFRGLGSEFELRVEPAFNDAAALAPDHDFGPIETWEVLSGDRDDPERHSLRLDRAVSIRSGGCPSAADEIDARIADLWTAGGSFESGREVPADVTVENTGDREHTFYVGYSVFDPNGEERHNDGTTDVPLTLGPGETKTVTVEWIVEGDAPEGTYDAAVAVWEARGEGGLENRLDGRNVDSAFAVRDAGTIDVDARVTDATVADGTFESGDEVPANVTVENTSDREHTFYVGYSVFDPNGEERHNDGTTDVPLTLGPGETRTVTVRWIVEDDAPSGSYDATVAVWEARREDGLENRLDRRDFRSVFEVD